MRITFAIWMFLLCGVFSNVAAVAEEALVASSGPHVFVVRATEDGKGWELAHMDVDAGPGLIRGIRTLATRPEAIAADGPRCWLVLPPRDADRPTRLVVSISVVRHPLNDVWYAAPPGTPQVLPPVPSEPVVAGLVAGPEELLLVFGPSQRQVRGVTRPKRPAASKTPPAPEDAAEDAPGKQRPISSLVPEVDPDLGGIVRWERPGGRVWQAIEAPEGLSRAATLLVGQVDRLGQVVPAIVSRDLDRRWSRSAFDPSTRMWQPTSLGEIGGDPFSLVANAGRTLLASRLEDGISIVDLLDAGNDVDLRPFVRVPEADLPRVRDIGMVLTEGGPWLIGAAADSVEVVTVDRGDGRTTGPVVAEEVKADGSLVQYPVMGIVMLSAFVAALLLRPVIDLSPAQPIEGLRGLGLARRAAGLCIDIAPAAMVVVVIYGLDPAVFLKDVMAGDLAVASPLIATELLAGGLAGILEVLTGASLGKWLIGGRILDLEGRPAGRAQRGLRAGLKLAVLLFWPLAIFALFEPLGRGIPELLSRTVVAPRPTDAPDAD